MEITILLPKDSSKEGIIQLKEFIDRASIPGINKTEIQRAPVVEGQMGIGDILNSIRAIIGAATDPLVELVKCLQKYADNYRTEITIPTSNGNIIISHGRSMKTEQLKKLVVAIQNTDRE